MEAGKVLEKGTYSSVSHWQKRDIELDGLLAWHTLTEFVSTIKENNWNTKIRANNDILWKLPHNHICLKQFYHTKSIKQARPAAPAMLLKSDRTGVAWETKCRLNTALIPLDRFLKVTLAPLLSQWSLLFSIAACSFHSSVSYFIRTPSSYSEKRWQRVHLTFKLKQAGCGGHFFWTNCYLQNL